jgi:hypothetical protein
MRPEGKRRLHPRPESILERLDVFAEVGWLAVVLLQGRLVVEQIEVAGRSGHEQLNDALRARRVMERRQRSTGPRFFRGQQGGQRDSP